VAWAERHAAHVATQGDLQAIRVIGATGNNLRDVTWSSRSGCSPA
jgi:excinuclease ABC subunit A